MGDDPMASGHESNPMRRRVRMAASIAFAALAGSAAMLGGCASKPAGSLGVPVTAMASIATDKRVFPPGGVVVATTSGGSLTDLQAPFVRCLLDQDTGGAIVAPGRADLFMGVGPAAEILAGNQHAEGRLHYLFLKSPLETPGVPASE
jgi:membrane-bound lytic murein transglycosylase